MDFFENLFTDEEDSSPTITYKKTNKKSVPIPKPVKQRRKKDTEGLGETAIGRDERQLKKGDLLDSDFELKSGQTTAGKGMDALKQSGNLDPAQIEKIASNLQGQGATRRRKNDLIEDLMDELDKGNSIDYQSLSEEQQDELRERMQSRPAPTTKKDFKSAEARGDLATDITPAITHSIPYTPEPRAPAPHHEAPVAPDNIHPTEHITADFTSTTTTTANAGESNDMRDFAHAHDELANPGIFTDLLASSAKIFKQHLKDSIDQGAIELAEGAIDKMFMVSGIPGGNIIKTPLKEALRNYVETTQETRYSRPLTDNKVNENQMKKLADPVMYPILIIAVNFYLACLSDYFEIPSFEGITGGYKRDYVMSLLTMMNVSEEGREFAMFSLQQLPRELLSAFKKNKDAITSLSFEEGEPIRNYIMKLELKYKELFNQEFYFALEKENAGDTLKALLDNLDNPHTLHEIAMGIKTLDSVLYDVVNNDGLFLSLIATIGEKLRPRNMQKEFNFMNHLVEGIVYYDRNNMPNGPQYKINNELDIMMQVQNSKEDVSMVERGNDVYVAFSGTKDVKKDFVRNIIRKGDSASQNDPKYNYTLKRGRTLIEKAKQIAQRKGGEVIIMGYSLGSYEALYSSLVNPTLKTIIYHPYFSQNERTRQLLTDLKDRDANLRILTTREDPFSVGINYYKDLLNVGYTRASKYHSPHDLENHIR